MILCKYSEKEYLKQIKTVLFINYYTISGLLFSSNNCKHHF